MNKIESLLQQQANAIMERHTQYKNSKELIDDTIAVLEPLALRMDFPNSIDFGFTGDKTLLNEVFKQLRRLGWNTQFRLGENDIAYSAFWSHDKSEVRIWISFTSTQCRRVKVGTKTVEVDVYETRCNDDMIPITDQKVPLFPANDLPF